MVACEIVDALCMAGLALSIGDDAGRCIAPFVFGVAHQAIGGLQIRPAIEHAVVGLTLHPAKSVTIETGGGKRSSGNAGGGLPPAGCTLSMGLVTGAAPRFAHEMRMRR
jgi:hypothetical protein